VGVATDVRPTTDFSLIRHAPSGVCQYAKVKPHPPNCGCTYPQRDFYNSRDFYALYHGGINIGKTRVLVVDAFDYAWNCPGSRQVMTEPTWQMVSDILIPTVEECYGGQLGTFFSMTRSPPVDITFANGSTLWFRSVDVQADRLRGPNLARVLMDEFTLGKQEEAFLILDGRIRQAGYLHQLKATGTPKGRNWVWRRYVDKPMTGPNGRVARFFAQTQAAEDAGLAPAGYTARLLENYGGWDNPLARQELGGQWLQMAGQVFPQFTRYDHVKTLDAAGRVLLKDRIGGIDFGGVSPTALVAVGIGAGGRAWAFEEWYKREATMDELGKAMADMQIRCGIRKWIADPSGKAQIDALRAMGFKVQKARHGNRIALRVQVVGARLNVDSATKMPGLYITPESPNGIGELEGLSWRRTKLQGSAEEIMTDDFERGDPDHYFDALANVLFEYDGKKLPGKRQTKAVRVYGDI
jgi:phosphoribosylformylglycinamidine (FGAM) synthase PurS component